MADVRNFGTDRFERWKNVPYSYIRSYYELRITKRQRFLLWLRSLFDKRGD